MGGKYSTNFYVIIVPCIMMSNFKMGLFVTFQLCGPCSLTYKMLCSSRGRDYCPFKG